MSRAVEVFAVEDTRAQLLVGPGPAGTVTAQVADTTATAEVGTSGGPVELDGLPAGTTLRCRVRGPGLDDTTLELTTVEPPPGAELVRVATVSDLHLGLETFDLRGRMSEPAPPGGVPHPERCLRAALGELEAWGAQRLVVKGDLTQASRAHEWETVGRLLGHLSYPAHFLSGNHDMGGKPGGLHPDDGSRRAGIRLVSGVEHVDLPGIRLVLVDTTVPGTTKGRLPAARATQAVERLADADGPALVCLHHYFQATPLPWFWPPGIPLWQALRFLRAAATANPSVLCTSGHTHRHRRRTHGPIVLTEVGSPKDFPGTWGGYVVHEGGIRQVVRRVAAPDCQAWLHRTASAAFGTWGHWSPGRLPSRCFTHRWPR